MRRAEWRTLPDEPSDPVRWVPRVLGETSSLFLLAAFVCAVLAYVTALNFFLVLAAVLALGLVMLPYRSPRPRPDLLTLPLPPGSFPVGVTVLLLRDPTGVDDAVASFVDGWLHIEGARAAFSLRATDAKFKISSADGTLIVTLPSGQSVRITPALFAASASNPFRFEGSSFAKTAERWLRERAVVPGEPVLPPLKTQPQIYARTLVRSVLLLLTCLASLGAMSRLPVNAQTIWLFIGLLTVAVVTPVYSVHRILFLRRIDTDSLRPYEGAGLPDGSRDKR